MQPPAGDPTNATPDVALDAAGTAFVVWVSTRSLGATPSCCNASTRANQRLGAREEIAHGLHANPRAWRGMPPAACW